MTPAFYAIGTLIVVAVLYLVIRVPVRKYLDARGDRIVSCPDNGEEVAVRVDAVHAAVTSAGASTHLRLESCTRWPEKAGCGQECLRQIEAQPEGLTLEWREIKPENLFGVLASHSPVCWDCHVAETFRRQRPDLVIDNPHVPAH